MGRWNGGHPPHPIYPLMGRRARVLAVAFGLGTLPVSPAAPGSSALPAGCDSSRSAVAFYSNGSAAATAAPVPCAVHTGYGSQEPHIRVAPNGDVVEQPARIPTGIPGQQTAGLAFSPASSKGSTWQLVLPDGHTFQTNDNAIHIDRVTGRLYVAIPTGYPQRTLVPNRPGEVLGGEVEVLSSPASPSGYVQWISTPMHGFVGSENSRFATGPAPDGQVQPVLGEQMAYWCGNNGILAPAARTCFRSFDGGTTWNLGAILLTSSVPRHPECGGNGESFSPLDGNYPQVGPDGSLWVTVQCGGTTYLARSTDEAASFPIIHRTDGTPVTIPGSTRELRVDTDGTLYAAGLSGTTLSLRISSDGGLTWSDPLNMTAPDVRTASVGQWQVAIGTPGQVAVTYLTPHAGGGQDAYITITHDALVDPNPVFYAAMVNSPSTALTTKSGIGDDFIDVDIAPDGTPWAAFYADCTPTDAFCATALGGPVPEGNIVAGPQATVVGRLVWP